MVYRPPNSSVSSFIDEFVIFLETVDMVSAMIIICGDFNLWFDDLDARYVRTFIDTMATFNLENGVDRPTSIGGHTIDLVFTDRTRNVVHNLHVDEACTVSPTHKLITFQLTLETSRRRQSKIIKYRSKKTIDPDILIRNISSSMCSKYMDTCIHLASSQEECHECLYGLYNATARVEYEKIFPLAMKEIVAKDESPWFNGEILRAKKEKKKKEIIWRARRTAEARADYNRARNYEKMLIIRRKREYYREKTSLAGTNIKKLYRVLDNLTGNKRKNSLPEGYTDRELADEFLNFFDGNINKIVSAFNITDLERQTMNVQVPNMRLSAFCTVDASAVGNFIKRAKFNYCANDPIPMNLIIDSRCFVEMVDITTKMVNRSITDGLFPNCEKHAIVKPVIKGKLDPQSLSSFRPVSNLIFQSKILECVILSQLSEHLYSAERFLTVNLLTDVCTLLRLLCVRWSVRCADS